MYQIFQVTVTETIYSKMDFFILLQIILFNNILVIWWATAAILDYYTFAIVYLKKYILQEINGCNIQSNSKVVHHHNLWRKKIVQVCSNYGGYFMPIDGAERRKFTVWIAHVWSHLYNYVTRSWFWINLIKGKEK